MNIYIRESVLKSVVCVVLLLFLVTSLGCVHHINIMEPRPNSEIPPIKFNVICIAPPKEIKTDNKWSEQKYNEFLMKIKSALPNQIFSCEKSESNERILQIQLMLGEPTTILNEKSFELPYFYVFLFTLGMVPFIRDFDVDTKVGFNTNNGEYSGVLFSAKYRKVSHIFLLPIFPFIKSEEDILNEDSVKVIQKILENKKSLGHLEKIF